jgi:ferredoxin
MLPSERREFVRTHRTCVFGYERRQDGPAMSIVYYIPTDSDELLVSTMRGRAKAKAVGRDAKVSLCVLDERWPFAYLQVYCDWCIKAKPRPECILKIKELKYDDEQRIVGWEIAEKADDVNMIWINQDDCIRCGACVAACPVDCISIQKVSLVTEPVG